MSERIQRRANDHRNAALEREKNARERAKRNHQRHEPLYARHHELSAQRQALAAEVAKQVREADAAIEGDQLDESSRAPDGDAGPTAS